MQFKGKLINQTWENYEKANFGADFDRLGPDLGKNFFTSHKTLFEAIILWNLKEN